MVKTAPGPGPGAPRPGPGTPGTDPGAPGLGPSQAVNDVSGTGYFHHPCSGLVMANVEPFKGPRSLSGDRVGRRQIASN